MSAPDCQARLEWADPAAVIRCWATAVIRCWEAVAAIDCRWQHCWANLLCLEAEGVGVTGRRWAAAGQFAACLRNLQWSLSCVFVRLA